MNLTASETKLGAEFVRMMGFTAMAQEFIDRPEYRERILRIMRREIDQKWPDADPAKKAAMRRHLDQLLGLPRL